MELDLDLDVATPAGADHRLLASTDIRFGRMRLQNALGSALLDLPISLTTQYYNGSGFVTNSADSCTTLQRSDIRFDFVTSAPRLAACENVTSPAAGVTFAGGVATLRLTKPTSQHEGVVDLSVNLNGTGGQYLHHGGCRVPDCHERDAAVVGRQLERSNTRRWSHAGGMFMRL